MNKRLFDYMTSVIITVSGLFLLFFTLAIQTTLFTEQGSPLNQGYAGKNGDTNLNNIAVGALIALAISVVLNRLIVSKQTKLTRLIRIGGTVIIILAGILFLIFAVVVAYALLTGRFLEGWEF